MKSDREAKMALGAQLKEYKFLMSNGNGNTPKAWCMHGVVRAAFLFGVIEFEQFKKLDAWVTDVDEQSAGLKRCMYEARRAELAAAVQEIQSSI